MDELDAVFRAQDRRPYTLEFALPRRGAAKRRYELDVRVLLPMVEGSLYLPRGERSIEGRVIQFASPADALGSGDSVSEEFVFRVNDASAEVRVPLRFSVNGLSDAVTWFREAFTVYESDDLGRHLVRLVRHAGARLGEVIHLCHQLASSEDPADALSHAELLWARARLLMLSDQDPAAAQYAVQGCHRAQGSGLPLGSRMVRAGQELSVLLEGAREVQAAQRVRNLLSSGRDRS
ncbi:hypothetical protein ABZ876_33125 [Streptomyces sp. NPDC046931]|uniref:hypothetical protein n=1 Tax=Streptomyces sp. NPDC046931 TaxID=3154806 RepID=UPI0033EF6DCF